MPLYQNSRSCVLANVPHYVFNTLFLFEIYQSINDFNFRTSSTPSLMDIDSETNSKDFNLPSPVSSLPPPTYESLFGDNQSLLLPPSYSETFRNQEDDVILSESDLENIRESTV